MFTYYKTYKELGKKINNNGFEYVDLGLPSGTLWATMNVGARKPSDYGLFFQWGDTSGYTADQVRKDKQFNWSDYKFSIDGSSTNFSKYTTIGATLELEDDAAHVNMGGRWHIPTPTQIRELLDNTRSSWTTQDGVNGMLFTSNKDSSKSIFFPAAGCAWDGSFHFSSNGDVWSSMLSTGSVGDVQYLTFSSGFVYLNDYNRYSGRSVRGVIG